MKNKRDEMLGHKFLTNNSGECTIVSYVNNKEVLVEFKHPFYIAKCAIRELQKGEVKNPFVPSFYGKGFIGEGPYQLITHKRERNLWVGLLRRLFSEDYHKTHPTYKEATVCKEWLCFQNFAAWCESQEFFDAKDDNGKFYQLDKDILFKGSKIYSSETCCFVPSQINSLFSHVKSSKGGYPVGVSYVKGRDKFHAGYSNCGKLINLGHFKTPEQAFNAYKAAKESHIKFMANSWKDRIDDKVYQVLINYEVEITD